MPHRAGRVVQAGWCRPGGAGRVVNARRVERIWRREGLKVPQKPPERGRLWLNDGSCIRLRPEYPSHVWSCDFAGDRPHNGRKFRMLSVIGAFTGECTAIRGSRKRKAAGAVSAALIRVFASAMPALGTGPCPRRGETATFQYGSPKSSGPSARHPRPRSFRQWPRVHRQGPARMDCSGWSRNGLHHARQPMGKRRLRKRQTGARDALPDGGIFCSLKEARSVIEGGRQHDSTVRPQSSPGPQAILPGQQVIDQPPCGGERRPGSGHLLQTWAICRSDRTPHALTFSRHQMMAAGHRAARLRPLRA